MTGGRENIEEKWEYSLQTMWNLIPDTVKGGNHSY